MLLIVKIQDGFRVIFALGYGALAVLMLLLTLIGLPQQLLGCRERASVQVLLTCL